MLFKKKKKKLQFEDLLERFKPFKKDYAIKYSQTSEDYSLEIESLIKPSKPPKKQYQKDQLKSVM